MKRYQALNIIYALKNKINNKVYVGQTWQSLEDRWNRGHGYIGSLKLENAINKYGKENFYYEIITACGTQDAADYWEQYFIEKFGSIKNGYNIAIGGARGVMQGRRHSPETIAKMSESHKGNTAHLGIPHSEETKKILSEKARIQFATLGHPQQGKTFIEMYSEGEARKKIEKMKATSKGQRRSIATEFQPQLSYEIADQIRDVRKNTKYTQEEIGDMYDISGSLVCNIINNKRWVRK